MRKSVILFVAMLLMAGSVGVWWLIGRVDRAISALRFGGDQAQLEAMRLLAGRTDDPTRSGPSSTGSSRPRTEICRQI